MKLLVLLFILKLYARINIFKLSLYKQSSCDKNDIWKPSRYILIVMVLKYHVIKLISTMLGWISVSSFGACSVLIKSEKLVKPSLNIWEISRTKTLFPLAWLVYVFLLVNFSKTNYKFEMVIWHKVYLGKYL